MMETRIPLHKSFFSTEERVFVENDDFKVTLFRFPLGVEAVRMQNRRGAIVMLPFQGQQIWSANFGGRELTMLSMFDQPRPTQTYLQTYGAFFIHCGVTAVGAPSADDDHPLHGELPNAPYHEAYLELNEDETGRYVALGGLYRHIVAFKHRFRAEPLVKLYADSSVMSVGLRVTNEKRSTMDLMYLAHANFRPVDHARLVYSAKYDAAHVRVRREIPSHIAPPPGYAELLQELAHNPAAHHVMTPGKRYDPEAVFAIDYLADAQGWCHTLQVLPDGTSDYIAHRHSEAPRVNRWLCRTPDQDGLGIAFPSTCGVLGYTAEKAAGHVLSLEAGSTWSIAMKSGALDAAATRSLMTQIDQIAGRV